MFMKKIFAVAAATCIACASVATASLSASAEGKSEAPYTAWIATSLGGQAQWEADTWDGSQSATINENGKYTVTAVVPDIGDGTGSIEFLSIETDINVYAFVAEGGDYKTEGTLSIAVDKIYVVHADGTEDDITYNGPGANAYCTRDDGSSARLNIINTWGGKAQQTVDISKTLDNAIGTGDVLSIDFTVNGIAAGGGDASAVADDSTLTDNTMDTAEIAESSTGSTSGSSSDDTSATTTANPNAEEADTTNTTAANDSTSGNTNNSSNKTGSSSNDTVSQTGDAEVAAVALGAVAALSLAAVAVTAKKRK